MMLNLSFRALLGLYETIAFLMQSAELKSSKSLDRAVFAGSTIEVTGSDRIRKMRIVTHALTSSMSGNNKINSFARRFLATRHEFSKILGLHVRQKAHNYQR